MFVELFVKKPKVGTMIEINHNDKDILIANIDNKLFCADNICPHEGIKLTLGCFKDNRIKCSLHGFSFDLVTGKADEDNIDSLNIYSIKEEADKILIDFAK